MNAPTMSTLDFEPESHTYRVDGRVLPSVTQVLKPVGFDYDTVPFHILNHAAQRGTAVHLATEFYDDGDLDEESIDPEILPYVNAWRLFREESGFVVDRSEVRLYSKRHGYAGTVDAIGFIRGRRIMVEKKTTAQLHPSTAIQVSAYYRAYNDSVPSAWRVRSACSVWLRRDGTYRFDAYDPLDHWAAFLALLNPDDPQSGPTLEAWKARYI